MCAVALLAGACSARGPVEPLTVTAPRAALQAGVQAYDDQDYSAAIAHFGQALALFRSLDDGAGQVMALVDLADCARILGEPAVALDHVKQAEAVMERDGAAELRARVQLLKAQALLDSGRAAEARPLLDALTDDKDAALKRAATLERARLALAQADADADAWLERARAVSTSQTQPNLLRLEAMAAQRAGDRATAQAKLEAALAQYRSERYRPGIAATHEALGELALQAGDRGAARDHYERALAIRTWLKDRSHGEAARRALATLDAYRKN